MTSSHLTLRGQIQGQLHFEALYYHKGAELGHMLLLNINRKASMRNLMMWLHFTLVTLKDQCQGHSHFEGLYFMSF